MPDLRFKTSRQAASLSLIYRETRPSVLSKVIGPKLVTIKAAKYNN